MSGRVVILGAGHAGGTVAALLRQYGYGGPIALVGDEPIPPYQRPPLSKAWLKGEADADSLALKPLEFYAANGIDFLPKVRAVELARAERIVALSDQSRVAYDHLIIATGARAAALQVPGARSPGILSLRSAADAEALKASIAPGRRVIIVGGGYIGLEAAASIRALGGQAVVIEREDRLLARVASSEIASFFHRTHAARGVEIIVGASVAAIEARADRADAVVLNGGRVIEGDSVLVGVGAIANDEIACAAGLDCDRGVIVDHNARTSDPAIFAIGDVARRPLPLYEHRLHRLESVPSALELAKQAASAIAGKPRPADETPWFWSDQYEFKLQIAGLPFDVDALIVRGDPAAGKFAVFHLQGQRVRAVEALNAPPEFMMGRQLILSGKAVDAQKLANSSASMKEVGA